MESLNHQNNYTNSDSSGSNVELTLFGIDKKWVRSNGSWVDKSKVTQTITHDAFPNVENEATSSPWWKFWKA